MHPLDDTIVAVASPPGGAARGIVRLSGPQVFECLAAAFQGPPAVPQNDWASPRVFDASLRLPDLHSPLPCEVYLWPRRGYTGQPCAEIHTLGSPPLLAIVVRRLCEAGARLAGPGEFTLRAFLSGRIDLTQAEAVLGVIEAPDAAALGVALEQLAGGLRRPLNRLRDVLLDLLAHVEAGFDFPDEDLPFIARAELDSRLAEAEQAVAALARQMQARGDVSADALRVVLVGRPNAGKSSLFNALIGRAAAIVSPQPGTTRDYLAAELDFDGVRCCLIDTAGVESQDESRAVSAIEQSARAAAEAQRCAADATILCIDATRPADERELRALRENADPRRIVVLTKCDQPKEFAFPDAIETSSLTGTGIELLINELRRKMLAERRASGVAAAGTAARCRDSLRLASESLGRARAVVREGFEELAAAEIRAALDELGKITGAVYSDDVLDRIFSRFCIGK